MAEPFRNEESVKNCTDIERLKNRLLSIDGHLWKGSPEPQWEYEAVLKRLKELYLYSL